MAAIDVLKYEGPNDVLIWKWRSRNISRENELRYGTQVVINESQEAIFYKGGKALDILGPGTHTLKTSNLPLLSAFINMPFGGNSPFKAEVFYVNKSVALDTKWGLQPFNLLEPNFQIPIPVSARGSYAIKVDDSRTFVTQIVGTTPDVDAGKVKEYFRGVVTENVKDVIGKISKEQSLSPVVLETIVKEVSDATKNIISRSMEKYGILLDLFTIEAIPLIDDDPRVKQVIEEMRKIMADDLSERKRLMRHAQFIDVYKTERVFDTTQTAAESLGSGGGGGMGGEVVSTILGVGIGASLSGTMGKVMGDALQSANSAMSNPPNQNIPSVNCSKCNSPIQLNSKFCNNCGTPIETKQELECPNCKAKNESNAKFCNECGSALAIKCSQCGKILKFGAKFCEDCGNKIS
jgi:membrane protease subunit (stomatin/prohibitin family)